MENIQHFGQWGIVLIMITIFVWFIFRFLRPQKKREWQRSGIFGAFLIALYTEMYGFPLTIYILTSLFGIDIPANRIEGQHLWAFLFGWGQQGAVIEMAVGYLVMTIGILLVIAGWKKIYQAKNTLAFEGVYRYVRHPQYTGIILITAGMLIHWPTIITILMWPAMIIAYYNLAKKEEKEMAARLGQDYIDYQKKVPMFLPSIIAIKNKIF